MSHPLEATWNEIGLTVWDPGNEDTQIISKCITVSLGAAVFFGALGSSFVAGYNWPVVNAPAPYVKNFYNKTWMERYGEPLGEKRTTLLWSTTVSIYSIGGAFGAVIVTILINILGRKGILLLNDGFALAAAVLMGTCEKAGSFEMMIIGRLVMGLHAGVRMSAIAIYLAEISPRHIRGSICQMNAILFTSGVFIGQVWGLPEVLGQESRWNFLFAFVAVPALLQLIVLPFFPESPRFLLMEKKDEAGAERAFRRFLGKEDVSQEMAEVQAESLVQRNMKVTSVLGLLRDPAVRWQIITVNIIMICFTLCGVGALFFYTTVILQDAGFASDLIPYITLSTGGTQVVFSIITNDHRKVDHEKWGKYTSLASTRAKRRSTGNCPDSAVPPAPLLPFPHFSSLLPTPPPTNLVERSTPIDTATPPTLLWPSPSRVTVTTPLPFLATTPSGQPGNPTDPTPITGSVSGLAGDNSKPTGLFITKDQGVIIERLGRRLLLLIGYGGMAVGYALLTVCLKVQDRATWIPYLSFISILVVIAFYSLGPVGVSYVVTSELFEQSYRPAALMIGGVLSWISLFIVGLMFPYMQEALQAYVFLVFMVICLLCAIYLFIILPETKNKTFVEISRSFAKRNKIPAAEPESNPENNGEVGHVVNGQTLVTSL